MKKKGQRQSTNVEDRRPVFTGVAPWNSSGYNMTGYGPPDLNKPVGIYPWDQQTSVDPRTVAVDRERANIAQARRKRPPMYPREKH